MAAKCPDNEISAAQRSKVGGKTPHNALRNSQGKTPIVSPQILYATAVKTKNRPKSAEKLRIRPCQRKRRTRAKTAKSRKSEKARLWGKLHTTPCRNFRGRLQKGAPKIFPRKRYTSIPDRYTLTWPENRYPGTPTRTKTRHRTATEVAEETEYLGECNTRYPQNSRESDGNRGSGSVKKGEKQCSKRCDTTCTKIV